MTEISETGKVAWFNDRLGYGFIKPDNQPAKDCFIHISDVKDEDIERLSVGQRVNFKRTPCTRGREKAVDVNLVQ